MTRKPKQLPLALKFWGGKRRGAGRKPIGNRAGVTHRHRPKLTRHTPAHVTLRLRPELRSLRNKTSFKAIRAAFVAGCNRHGMRLTQFSVQRDHVHLIAEADNRAAMSRGLQGLCIRMARGLNRALGRKGKVFADRYHIHVLRGPRQVRNALCYVLNNRRKHTARHGLPVGWRDPHASTNWFDGWRGDRRRWRPPSQEPRSVASAKSYLLQKGWRAHGLIGPSEIPGPRPRH